MTFTVSRGIHHWGFLDCECITAEGRPSREATLVYCFLRVGGNEEALQVNTEYSRIVVFAPELLSTFPFHCCVTTAEHAFLSFYESQCVALVVTILMEVLRTPPISGGAE